MYLLLLKFFSRKEKENVAIKVIEFIFKVMYLTI